MPEMIYRQEVLDLMKKYKVLNTYCLAGHKGYMKFDGHIEISDKIAIESVGIEVIIQDIDKFTVYSCTHSSCDNWVDEDEEIRDVTYIGPCEALKV